MAKKRKKGSKTCNGEERSVNVGVHDKAKYGEIKDLLDIPREEPIFIFRAQDRRAPQVLSFYHLLTGMEDADVMDRFREDVLKMVQEFHRYQTNYPERVKEPD